MKILKDEVENWAKLGHRKLAGEFVLLHGKAYKPAPFKGKKKPDKMCFKNALHYALANNLKYVEGYAKPGYIEMAMDHAWCADEEGNVIDPTWRNGEEAEYYGVEFDPNLAVQMMVTAGYYGLFSNGSGALNVPFFKKFYPEWWATVEKKKEEV